MIRWETRMEGMDPARMGGMDPARMEGMDPARMGCDPRCTYRPRSIVKLLGCDLYPPVLFGLQSKHVETSRQLIYKDTRPLWEGRAGGSYTKLHGRCGKVGFGLRCATGHCCACTVVRALLCMHRCACIAVHALLCMHRGACTLRHRGPPVGVIPQSAPQ